MSSSATSSMKQDQQPNAAGDDDADCENDDDDENILLRRYQPSDHAMICEIFRRGMESNTAAAWRSVCSSRNVMAIMLSCGAVVGSGAWFAFTKMARTGAIRQLQQRQQQQPQQALGVALGSSILAVMGIMAKVWFEMSRGFRGYVEQSLKDDLRSPQELLKVYGGKGAIVVAVDKSTNEVVGMVAGQEVKKKEGDELSSEEEEEKDGRNSGVIFELRRMSVDTRIQRRGIGKRLIRQLEKELLPHHPKKVILTCSSIQYAAHRLYEKIGFRLVETMTFSDLSWLFRQGVGFRRYEKDY